MVNEQKNPEKSTGILVFWGLPVVAILCCGLPFVIGVFGFTAAGAFLMAHRYWLFGGLVILMAIVMFGLSRKGRTAGMDACCVAPTANE